MKADKITPLKKMVGPLALTHYGYQRGGFGLEHILLASIFGALFSALLLLYGTQIASALHANLPVDARDLLSSLHDKLR